MMTLLELLQDGEERRRNVTMAHDILKSHDLTVAEDVVSETYTELIATNPVTEDPKRYLHRAIKLRCIDFFRQKKTESDKMGRPIIEFRPLPDLPECPVRSEGEARLIQRDVQRALLGLSPQERYVAEQLLMGSNPGDQEEVALELGMVTPRGVHSGTFSRLVAVTKQKLRFALADYQPL